MQDHRNFEKYAAQDTVAMKTPRCLNQKMSYIVARSILAKFTNFGGV